MGKSSRLNYAQIRSVFRVLNEMQEKMRESPGVAWREHAINELCPFLGARQGSSVLLEGWHPQAELKLLSAAHAGWVNNEVAKAWQAGVLPSDPRMDTLINRGTEIGGVLRTRTRQQMILETEWQKSWEYAILKDVDIGQQLVCWFNADAKRQASLAMTFHRPYGEKPFTMRQRNVLHLFNVELYRLHLKGKIDPAELTEPKNSLTPRQGEVLKHLLEGDSQKQIARKLGISAFTVNDHVKAIYRHYAVGSRGELMAKFVDSRL